MNWEPVYALLILFSTVTTWGAANLLSRYKGSSEDDKRHRKIYLWAGILVNIAVLFTFKYANFFTESCFSLLSLLGLRMPVPHFDLLLPVGISFYTFQAIGYMVDVYKRSVAPEKSLMTYALFVSFFPQLVAGPIERSSNLLPQFYDKHTFNSQLFITGLKMMLFGYFMKLCIADNVSPYVDAVFGNLEHHNGRSILLASFFFTFQIFCDFSGYSLIAIGAARCMGFSLMQNFRQPYLSVSVQDFWRRWHISLSSWFTEYVYIPLGGNRCSARRNRFNTIATMLISGLWHGANWTFVAWGGLHGLALVAYKLTKKVSILPKVTNRLVWLKKIMSILFTFTVVWAGWIFFRADSLHDAILAFHKIFTSKGVLYNGNGMPTLLLSLMLIGFLMVREIYIESKWRIAILQRHSMAWDIAYSVFMLCIILLCGEFNGGQFIYFQF